MVNVLGFLGHPRRRVACRDSLFADWDSGWYHNSAAALVNERGVLAAAEEERFTRVKNTGVFPTAAIRYCLETLGRAPDVVAFGETGGFGYLRDPSINIDAVRNLLQSECDLESPGTEIILVDHHTSHAFSAAMASGWREALVVTLDGFGDGISGSFRMLRGGRLTEPHRTIPFSESLGRFYSSALSYFGYSDGDEYKVMGLAPHGNPRRFAPKLAELFEIGEDGSFAITDHDQEAMFERLRALGPERRTGEAFEAHHADIAASLQESLEKIVQHVLAHEMKHAGTDTLCLAGGVAHNSSMIGRLSRHLRPGAIFVQPAADDSGIALGAAYAGLDRKGEVPAGPLRDVYLGSTITPDDIGAATEKWSGWITVEHSEDPVETTARLLASGSIVGVAQGRMEYGPRALGNRSILADPRPESNRDRVNRLVKSRESFRPFAPATPVEDAARFFALGLPPHCYQFMTVVCEVRVDHRHQLGAVTHVDGTARLQTVTRSVHPFFHALLTRFGELSGIPVLLNTSLNNHREPIVRTADEAIIFLLTSGIDCLLLGSGTLVRRAADASLRGDLLRASRVGLRPGCFAAVSHDGAERRHVVTGPGRREVRVGESAFAVLTGAIRARDASTEALHDLFHLWTERLVDVTPGRMRPSDDALPSERGNS